MSEDQRTSAPDDEEIGPIDVVAEDAQARRLRRAKGKLALRIPDDEVARPQATNGEQPIQPTPIISLGSSVTARAAAPPREGSQPNIHITVDTETDETPIAPAALSDIDVPVVEDEAEFRASVVTLPGAAPLSSDEALEIDAEEAAAVLSSSRPPPPVSAPILASAPPPPRVPGVPSKPPPPPPSAPSTDVDIAKLRPVATALVDEEEARGIEEVEPERTSSPPSEDEVASVDFVAVEPAKDGREASPAKVLRGDVPPSAAPSTLVPAFSSVTPATGVASPLAPPSLSEGLVPRKRTRPWWEELFNDDFIRTLPRMTDAQIAAEVDFVEDSLGVAVGGNLLDLGCGTGRHAIELTRRGYRVVGFDLSLAMLARAGEEAQERDQKINFVQGDMREMTFDEAFDGIYCWGTTFGFFEEDKNAHVVTRVHKALRQGGQFLLDVVGRDFISRQAPSLAWFEGDGCVCMDEMQVDWITSRMRIKRTMMFDDGRSKEIEYSIRVYSLHELGKLLHECGFRVAEVSGRIQTPGVFLGPDSPRTLILAEKR